MTIKRRFGWKPDRKDHRDLYINEIMRFSLQSLVPVASDLEAQMPHVYDQAEEGSCTANAGAAYVQFLRKKTKLGAPTPSRNFLYYNTRLLEGDAGADDGAECRDVFKALSANGWCQETPTWPYLSSNVLLKPSAAAYAEAKRNIIPAMKYARVAQTAPDLISALSAGMPVLFGFMCSAGIDSAEAAETGFIQTPATTDQIIGGHCVLLVGHDLSTNKFKIRNSWGAGWGIRGYGTMAFDYVLNPQLSSDFWVMTN